MTEKTVTTSTTDPQEKAGTMPCPHPECCPFGAKPAGYRCGMGFELLHPAAPGADGQAAYTKEQTCAFCVLNRLGLKNLVESQNRGNLVLAAAIPHGRG
jgi:hypothetical protein